MNLALLQPTFAPNLYDLSVMLQADRIVLQDSDQWSRKGRVHRALIRTPDGTQYIHIPVRTEDRKKAIRDVRIDQEEDWITPVLRSFRYNYRNSFYFDFYEPEIRADFTEGRGYEFLLPFVLYLRRRLFRFLELNIDQKEILASELAGYTTNPDQLAKRMATTSLFQEHASRHYQRQAELRIDPDFKHPEYRQHFSGFEPWCSLYDLLFQYGPESFKVLDEL